jgi:hypothetical protein
MATDVPAILLAPDERHSLNVTPILRKKRLVIEVSALTLRIRLLGSRRLEELPMRHELGGAMAAMSDRLS